MGEELPESQEQLLLPTIFLREGTKDLFAQLSSFTTCLASQAFDLVWFGRPFWAIGKEPEYSWH